jgi:hypothetical protein
MPLPKKVLAKISEARAMAWFLIAAAVVVVVAISAAVIAWAAVVRDAIRLVDRLSRRAPD